MVNKTWQSEQQSYNAMNQEQAVHHTTLISGYHVSAASEHHRKNQENIIEFAFTRIQYFVMEI